MCIAIMNPSNVTLKKKVIKNCWDNNYNGAGLLFVNQQTGKLDTFKELTNFDKYYDAYTNIRKNHKESTIILHFRIATHGGVTESNCHPFIVDDTLGFVHNGIISGVPDSKEHSDTYMFNEHILKRLPKDFIYNDVIKDLIGDYIGYSKLVFLDVNNDHHIIGEEKGIWDLGGCWFSNSSYKEVDYYDYGGTRISKGTKVTTYPSYSSGLGATKYKSASDFWNDDWNDDSTPVSELFKDVEDDKCTCEYCGYQGDDVGKSANWDAQLCSLCDAELTYGEDYTDEQYESIMTQREADWEMEEEMKHYNKSFGLDTQYF